MYWFYPEDSHNLSRHGLDKVLNCTIHRNDQPIGSHQLLQGMKGLLHNTIELH